MKYNIDFIKNLLAKDYEIEEAKEETKDDVFMIKNKKRISDLSHRIISLFDANYYHGIDEVIYKLDLKLFSKIRLARSRENDKKIQKKIDKFIQKWEIRLDNFSIKDSINEIQYEYENDIKKVIQSL